MSFAHRAEMKIGFRRVIASMTVLFLLFPSLMLWQQLPRNVAIPEAGSGTADSLGAYHSRNDHFIENRGQVNGLVRYYSTNNPSVAFRDDGVMFVGKKTIGGQSVKMLRNPIDRFSAALDDDASAELLAYMIHFEGANRVTPIGVDRSQFNNNFFIGNDSSKWRTDVPNYREIAYYNLYDGIDLLYHPAPIGVKYEFIVHPGANPDSILLRYEGVEGLRMDESGILVHTSQGDVRDSEPYAYQKGIGEVECSFATRNSFSYGFDCEKWDESEPLVIDPLVYSTYLGGLGIDLGGYLAIDALGNAYISGMTKSIDFPTTVGSFSASYNGGWDTFVAKLNPDGSGLAYSTFLGGDQDDFYASIAVDSAGNAYLVGMTQSSDFPTTPGSYDRGLNGTSDAFVTKLNATGSGLTYSTFLGGNSTENGRFIAIDAAGDATVVGDTNSNDFPTTPGALNESISGRVDAFVTKLNATGNGLVYSTFLGGTDDDSALGIATDVSGNAYVTGHTYSWDFPISPGALDGSFNGIGDAFVAKLNAAGNRLLYSTFLGGSGLEQGWYIAADMFGCAYVTGFTNSADFPVTLGAFDLSFGGAGDAFVAKLNATGSGLVYSTFLGGIGVDSGSGIALDSALDAYVAGTTASNDFPVTSGAFDTSLSGTWDAFVTKLNAIGNSLVYSTYLGGSDVDGGGTIAVDSSANVYVTGETDSNDFPITPGAFRTTYWGNRDVFAMKTGTPAPDGLPDLTVLPADIAFVPSGPVTVGASVTIDASVHNIGKANVSQVGVRFYDGFPPGSPQIGADQAIPSIQRLGGTGTASVTWLAGPPGSHDICVSADPDNTIAEENEFNNIACATIDVLSLPDLTPTFIAIVPPPPLLNNTASLVNVTVANLGDLSTGGFDLLLFNDRNGNLSPDAGENIGLSSLAGLAGHSQIIVSFDWAASPTGNHSLCAYADPAPGTVSESNETNNVACVSVVVQPGPIVRPDYVPTSPQPSPPIRVGMSSPVSFSIQVLNQGNGTATGDATVAFYEQSLPPFSTFVLSPLAPATTSSRFTATWTSPAIPGTYLVSVDVDQENNVTEWDETNNIFTWTIEVVSGPLTSLFIGSPNYTSASTHLTYVKSSTPLDFSVIDQSGLGIRNTTYRIDGGDWANYTATGQFSLAGEGQHALEWYSEDYAGNVENASFANLTVDDTPPATTISPATEEVDAGTLFSLGAIDAGSGVNYTEYRVDGGTWTGYTASFTLSDGHHNITYRSVDNLGNPENEKYLNVTVSSPYVPPAIEANYKPLVALVFAIILAVVGLWSARKRPWKGGKNGTGVVKAFMLTSMPFVLAEAATGVASFLTGQLSIPPPIGAGTVVDAAILAAGLSVALFRATRTRQSSA